MTKLNYNVRPRCTCGSPAAVECEIAEKVAQEELTEHERCLSGVYVTIPNKREVKKP